MGKTISVGISEMQIVSGDEVLISYALGSCIGTCIYDSVAGIMGLSHVLLPECSLCPNDYNVKKFADTAIREMVKIMVAKGASVCRMNAKIVGGAQMFINSNTRIGERNTKVVISELNLLGIRLVASDVGDNYGRTMECYAKDGKVIIKSMSRGSHVL